MSSHHAQVTWSRDQDVFTDKRYSREHRWSFDGGAVVAASSSPLSVPLPYSNAACVDPEEAYVAALSSCHMLWFLSLAAQEGFRVDSYDDAAEGLMEKVAGGVKAVTHVTLRPQIDFSGDRVPTDADVERLHHRAHESCYLANSVKTEIVVEPRHMPETKTPA